MKLIFAATSFLFSLSAFATSTGDTYYNRVKSAYDLATAYDVNVEANKSLKAGRCFRATAPNKGIAAALVIADFETDAGPIAAPFERKIASVWAIDYAASHYDERDYTNFRANNNETIFYAYEYDAAANTLKRKEPKGSKTEDHLRQDERYTYELVSQGKERIYCYYFRTNLEQPRN